MSKFFPYLGGKRLLAKTIISLLPEHRLYCEPFGGSGTVLLEKPPSPAEIYNDINGGLVNLFRILKYHPREFLDTVRWHLRSREDFELFKNMPSQYLTDIHRAAQLYYLLRAGYGGKPPAAGCQFGVSLEPQGKPLSIYRVEESLYEIHRRLENVTIEHLPYADCIPRYDRQDACFYLDPPYYHHEADYGSGIFNRDEFEKMALLLKSIRGSFLLSLNDLPEVRQIFAPFQFKEVATTYHMGTRHGHGKKVNELLIANYPLH
ncbi:MAG: DNA adenine methylase [Deltaproteobacteria bacterium]|nr:DNA adenine methylase [Deltaproteobacteria bacterium]